MSTSLNVCPHDVTSVFHTTQEELSNISCNSEHSLHYYHYNSNYYNHHHYYYNYKGSFFRLVFYI